MKRIAFFSGNRAEFGILFPIIAKIYKDYEIDIILSGAHVIKKWNTYIDVVKQLDAYNIKYNLYKVELPENDDVYRISLGVIYDWSLKYYKENNVDYGVVLGDRVESYGFALGTFYSRIPLIHFCGGDVVDVSNFDTNVRHSITKIANYHMVTSDLSRSVVIQMGEEDRRVLNIGNPSFDYERMGMLTSKEKLAETYNISEDDNIGIVTIHPSADKTIDENFDDFKNALNGIVGSDLERIFITYPNNDPGSEKIVDYLKDLEQTERLKVINSFGTFNYLGMMNWFNTIIIGNSSSGLLETAYYMVPVVNIGERQKGRIRGNNVFDCSFNSEDINDRLNIIIKNYSSIKAENASGRYKFGDGNAARKVSDFLKSLDNVPLEEKLFKKFIVR